MPPWSLFSIAMAFTPPGPAIAECDGDPSLAGLITDPANVEIELEAGCDHPVQSPDLDRAVVIRGQPAVYPTTRPRIVFPSGAVNNELFRLVAGANLTLESVDLVGHDGTGAQGGRAIEATGGVAHLIDVDAQEFVNNQYGAVVYLRDTELTVDSSNVSNNQALFGGVVWVDDEATATFRDTSLHSNHATGTGGFAFVETGGTLQLFDVSATDHTAPYGGFVGSRGAIVVDGLSSDGHHATGSTGGAFHVDNGNASLSLCDAELSNGSAATEGGAIYVRGPTTIGRDCAESAPPSPVIFTNHSANAGGAIHAFGGNGTLRVEGASFAQHSANLDGGTLYLQSNTTELTDIVIDGTTAGARGGALFVQGSVDFDLLGGDVSNGRAETDGGCLNFVAGTVDTQKIADLELSNCIAGESGGGLYANGGLTVEGLSVHGSQARIDGGGIHLVTDDPRTLNQVTITDSYAGEEGGGISLQSTNSQPTTLTDIVVERCDAVHGGALAVRDSTAVVDRFRFEEGFAAEGGAVFVHGNNSSADLSRGLVCGTTSGVGGVTARSTSPDLVLDQVAFIGNSGVRGGGLELQDTTPTTLDHLHFVGNVATYGAALFVEASVPATLDDVVVVDNHATSPTSGAIDGILPTAAWYEANTPWANPADPTALDTTAGLLFDGSCTWAALRTVDRAEQRGVWGPVSTDPATWPDGTDPFRDEDFDTVPWLHDCDDMAAARNYLSTEACDGFDNDCDGLVDDDDSSLDLSTAQRWYRDTDLDGSGDENVFVDACDAPDGYIAAAGDCDDGNGSLPAVLYVDGDGDGLGAGPPAYEACVTPAPPGYSFENSDCDDTTQAVGGPETTYLDADRDGVGSAVELGEDCPDNPDAVFTSNDCDDTRSDVFPSASETCDGIDQDCDGQIDEGVQLEVWTDADGDGYGVGQPTLSCDPSAGALIDGDCNDTDPERTTDCNDGTITHTNTGDDDDDDDTEPTDGGTEPADGQPTGGVANTGCACQGSPTPAGALGLAALLLVPWRRRRA